VDIKLHKDLLTASSNHSWSVQNWLFK